MDGIQWEIKKMIINYEEYFVWKINYKVKEERDEWNNKN